MKYDVYFIGSCFSQWKTKLALQILFLMNGICFKKTCGKLKGGYDVSFAYMSVLDRIAGNMI